MLPRCRNLPPDGGAALDELSGRGLRVLAVARRALEGPMADTSAETVERDLDLMALLGILDPPRPGMADALARGAGSGCERLRFAG
ncbi:MAG: hypothetical protein OEY41_06540 [Acidimicrobiia bacterium]|nr:hypothetical protein [Acidimicrobiia bacterium]